MKRTIILTFLFCAAAMLWAQWSSDVNNPNLIAGGPGEQVMPKVAVCSSGSTYISYFDNSSGGYKVWLKSLNMYGYEVWPSPVEMTGSISDTWLTDYDICVDQEDNAIVCFQDIRSGYNSIYAYKVSPSGQQLWGENGLSLSINASMDAPDYSPVVMNSSDNSTYVAWQHQSSTASIIIQKISPAGQPAWPGGLVMTAGAGERCNWPQLIESDFNDVLMKYYVDSGPFYSPNRKIKVARLAPDGGWIWDQMISDAMGIAAWTQVIGFAPDGGGGAVLSWHDDRDMNNINQAYFARITAQGEITTPINGAYVSSSTGYQHYYPLVDCDFEAQEARVVMRVTSADQNQYGAIMQVFDYDGNRLLTDAGWTLQDLSSYDHNPLHVINMRGKLHYLYYWMDSANPQVQKIMSEHNTEVGYYNSWFGGPVASTDTAKLHFSFDSYPDAWVIVGWEDGSAGGDIYAMRYWYNGNVGDCEGGAENVTAEFIPPSSVVIDWDAPAYSEPDYYFAQLGDLLAEVPANQTQFTFEGVLPGHYQVFVRAVYGDDMTSQEGGYIFIDVVSDADPVESIANFFIAPNPLHDATQLTWQNQKSGITHLELYNIRGQRLLSEELVSTVGLQNYQLSRNGLSSGLYLLKLSNSGGIYLKKLLVMP